MKGRTYSLLSHLIPSKSCPPHLAMFPDNRSPSLFSLLVRTLAKIISKAQESLLSERINYPENCYHCKLYKHTSLCFSTYFLKREKNKIYFNVSVSKSYPVQSHLHQIQHQSQLQDQRGGFQVVFMVLTCTPINAQQPRGKRRMHFPP